MELPEKRAQFRQLLCVTIRRVKETSHRMLINCKYRAKVNCFISCVFI